jgi:hypothetical protein
VAVNLTYQFVKRDPVVKAMITGRKPAEDFADQAGMKLPPAAALRALASLTAAAAIVLGLLRYLGAR